MWVYYSYDELHHHGILGMRWGKRNGPPYPLSGGQHSPEERKIGWRKSLDGKKNKHLYDRNEAEQARKRYWKKKGYSSPPPKGKTKNTRSDTNERKGLTDKQKKALLIGGAALAIGGAALMGYKLHQLNTESKVYKDGVRYIRNMISTSNESIADLTWRPTNENYGAYWLSERKYISEISDKIDNLPDVSKNPFISADNKNTVKNLRKDVTNLYKNLGNADTDRTNRILNEIKNETTNKIKTFKPETFEVETFTPETFEPERFIPETFKIDSFEPETLTIGEDYARELLKSNMDKLRKMRF